MVVFKHVFAFFDSPSIARWSQSPLSLNRLIFVIVSRTRIFKRCCVTSKDGLKKPAVSTNFSWDTHSGRLQPSSKKYGYKGRENEWDYGLRSLHCLYLSSLDVKHVNEENFEMTPAPTTHLTATTWERLSTPQ